MKTKSRMRMRSNNMLAPLPAIANMSIGPACFDGVAATLVLFYSIDCGREFIHLLKEHRDLPDLLVFQCESEARHRGEADSVLHRPERCGFGIVFASAKSCRSWPSHHEEPLSLSRKTSSFFI